MFRTICVLCQLRNGKCTENNLVEIQKLLITNGNTPQWEEPALVTPQNAVCTKWNQPSLHRHCLDTGQQMYVCPAKDTIGTQKGNHPSMSEWL